MTPDFMPILIKDVEIFILGTHQDFVDSIAIDIGNGDGKKTAEEKMTPDWLIIQGRE
jgi:hypothetical protein